MLVMEEEQITKYSCKFCHKIFPCGRSLGGHMRSHLITIKRSSDHEATLCKKKRSDRPRRYTNTTNPSCLNLSPFDQQEQEEVALSLILLSMESKLGRESSAPRKRLKSNEKYEIEVNSPKALIKENRSINPLGSDDSDHKKRKKSTKKKFINSRSYFPLDYKFSCMICKKGFHSYQALGGHRASHKKFKGCCAPTSDRFQENIDECKTSEDYERPTCSRVFPSIQAVDCHKRSHLINDQANNTDRSITEIRGLLDLNLPAPIEEDCNEFKPWWISSSQKYLLSS